MQLVQQRAAQAELEDYRRQLHEVTQSKKHLQAEIADLQDRLNAETAKRNEESGGCELLELA
jgi:myosin heavy chain 9/10/11/14